MGELCLQNSVKYVEIMKQYTIFIFEQELDSIYKEIETCFINLEILFTGIPINIQCLFSLY